MERSLWTDERIDDMVATSDQRFELLLARMDRLEARMDALYRQFTTFIVVQFAAQLGILLTVIVRT